MHTRSSVHTVMLGGAVECAAELGDRGVAWSRFATADPELARAFLRGAYSTRDLQLEQPRPGFGYAHRGAATGQFAIGQVHTRGSLRTELSAPPGPLVTGPLVISTVRRGRLQVDRSRFGDVDAGPGDTVLIPPRGRFRLSMRDVELDTVALHRPGLARYAAAAWGIDPDRLQLLGTRPVSPGAAEHWSLTVAHIRDAVLGNPAAAESPVILASAARLLRAAFLTAFPTITLTGSRAGGSAGRHVPPTGPG